MRQYVLGNVTPPSLRVFVNGVPARQGKGGGFVASVSVQPGENVLRVEGRAEANGPASVTRELRFKVRGYVPAEHGAVEPASLRPFEPLELEPGDALPVYFRGAGGLDATVTLGAGLAKERFAPALPPDRGYLLLTSDPLASHPPLAPGERELSEAGPGVWYRATLRVPEPAPGKGWRFGDSAKLTLRVNGPGPALELPFPRPVTLRDPSALPWVELADRPRADPGFKQGKVIARSGPEASYFLFLANGTWARAGRRWGPLLELKLDHQLSVWARADQVRPLPEGPPPSPALVYAVRTRKLDDGWTRVLVRLDQPVPVQVRQRADGSGYRLVFFGAQSEVEFLRVEPSTLPIGALSWDQEATERFSLEVSLRHAAWGYRYGFEGTDFYLDVRPPPRLVKGAPFRGLTVAVDPGHSREMGAIGPTRLLEKDPNWAVSEKLAKRLEAAGAKVLLTRRGEATEAQETLPARTLAAVQAGAHLLVSVHHNSMPEMLDPFDPNDAVGTSVYFHHPQSQPLANALQKALLEGLKLPDRGVGQANLALCRPTELPAVLTEAAFMIIPEQEELLRTEAFAQKEADALFRGLSAFLTQAQREQRPPVAPSVGTSVP